MLITIFQWFVKITAWPVEKLLLKIRVRCAEPEKQSRYPKGGAIIVSNHTNVYDFAALLFAFWTRTIRVQMAEILFTRPGLGLFLKQMGGIRVDRDAHSTACLDKSAAILKKGGLVGVFPEGRLPLPGEERPLPFREGAAYLALETGVPVIPVYISGRYFSREGIRVTIGTPLDLRGMCDPAADPRQAVRECSRLLREKVMELGEVPTHGA